MGWMRRAAAGLAAATLAAGGVLVLDLSGAVETGLLPDSETSEPVPALPSPGTPSSAIAPAGDMAPVPDAAAVGQAVAGAADRDDLPTLGAAVVDVGTGEVLFDEEGSRPLVPASSAKVLTATAALTALDPGTTFATRVVRGDDPSELVLVGGGDPTLTARPAGPDDTSYPRPTSLAALADATVARLSAEGIREVTLDYDDSLFAEPAVSPDWERGYVSSGVVAPVSALMVDHGRLRRDDDIRAADPADHAAKTFAALLEERGLSVTGQPAVASGSDGEELAAVRSAPLSAIVEHMLATSDNDTAEALLRHTAVAMDLPATFDGGVQAVTRTLGDLGLDTSDLRLQDGSGLSRGNRVPALTLAQALALAAGDDNARLRPVVTGLPVAGLTGTLEERFDGGESGEVAGTVRAKTGTLTGVSSLAGITTTREGRTVAFAFVANDVRNQFAARKALDDMATALTGCCG